MILDRIIDGCKTISVRGNLGTEILSVCNDSRKVAPGALFVAVKGFASDGHDYINAVVEKGASAIIYEDETKVGDVPENVSLIKVESSRYALAIAAANFYDNPSRKLTLVGITGTNGKTTTTTLVGEIFKNYGKQTYVVGNIGFPYTAVSGGMKEEDVTVCEVSSFQMESVKEFHPQVSAMLNITEDHLNRHKEKYQSTRNSKRIDIHSELA